MEVTQYLSRLARSKGTALMVKTLVDQVNQRLSFGIWATLMRRCVSALASSRIICPTSRCRARPRDSPRTIFSASRVRTRPQARSPQLSLSAVGIVSESGFWVAKIVKNPRERPRATKSLKALRDFSRACFHADVKPLTGVKP